MLRPLRLAPLALVLLAASVSASAPFPSSAADQRGQEPSGGTATVPRGHASGGRWRPLTSSASFFSAPPRRLGGFTVKSTWADETRTEAWRRQARTGPYQRRFGGFHWPNDIQWKFLTMYFCFAAICFVMWYMRVLFPFKLLCTLFHEMSHAMAALLCCASVTGIEVDEDLSGMCYWSVAAGRMPCAFKIVSPAGYLGSALWGAVITTCCVNGLAGRKKHVVVLIVVLIVVLVAALCFALCGQHRSSRPGTLVLTTIFFLSFSVWFIVATQDWIQHNCWKHFNEAFGLPFLFLFFMFVGVANTVFATYDIYDDCVGRVIARSDAYKFAENCCGTPVCVGVVWLIISIIIAVFAFCNNLLTLDTKGVDYRTPFHALADSSVHMKHVIYVPMILLVVALVSKSIVACCCR